MRDISLQDIKAPSDSATFLFDAHAVDPKPVDLGITCDANKCVEKTIVDGKLDIGLLKIVGRNDTHITVADDNFSQMGCSASRFLVTNALDTTILSSSGASAHVTALLDLNVENHEAVPTVWGEMDVQSDATAESDVVLESMHTHVGIDSSKVKLAQQNAKYGLDIDGDFIPFKPRGKFSSDYGHCRGGQRKLQHDVDTRTGPYLPTASPTTQSNNALADQSTSSQSTNTSYSVALTAALLGGGVCVLLVFLAAVVYKWYHSKPSYRSLGESHFSSESIPLSLARSSVVTDRPVFTEDQEEETVFDASEPRANSSGVTRADSVARDGLCDVPAGSETGPLSGARYSIAEGVTLIPSALQDTRSARESVGAMPPSMSTPQL